MFADKGESLEDYWEYTHRIFEWADGGTANMILDDGGDATLLIHLGLRAEKGDTKFLDGASNEEEEVLFASIKKRLKDKRGWYGKNAKNISGVTEETTTGVHRLYEMQKKARCCSPPSTSTTGSPSPSSTTSTAAAKAWSTASAAPPT